MLEDEFEMTESEEIEKYLSEISEAEAMITNAIKRLQSCRVKILDVHLNYVAGIKEILLFTGIEKITDGMPLTEEIRPHGNELEQSIMIDNIKYLQLRESEKNDIY